MKGCQPFQSPYLCKKEYIQFIHWLLSTTRCRYEHIYIHYAGCDRTHGKKTIVGVKLSLYSHPPCQKTFRVQGIHTLLGYASAPPLELHAHVCEIEPYLLEHNTYIVFYNIVTLPIIFCDHRVRLSNLHYPLGYVPCHVKNVIKNIILRQSLFVTFIFCNLQYMNWVIWIFKNILVTLFDMISWGLKRP